MQQNNIIWKQGKQHKMYTDNQSTLRLGNVPKVTMVNVLHIVTEPVATLGKGDT